MKHGNYCIASILTYLLVGGLPATRAQTAPATQAATTAPATAPSGTHYAVRIVRIPNNDLQPDHDEIQQMIPRLAAKRMQAPGLVVDTGLVSSTATNRDYHIAAKTREPIAKEMIDQLLLDFEKEMKTEHSYHQNALRDPATAYHRRAEFRLGQLTSEAQDRREHARQVTGRADSSVEGIQKAAATMDAERQRLELEKVGKTARRQAIEDQVASQSKQIEARVKEDPIAAELEKVVDAREQAVTRMQKHLEAGQPFTASEISDAVATAAEARARLLQRRLDATAEVGGETLEALNRELTTLSIDLHELDARLEFIKNELRTLGQATRTLAPIEQLEADIAEARETKKKTAAVLEGIQRQISESGTPTIEVISSENLKMAPGAESLFSQ